MYAEVTGVLAQSHFHSIRKRFTAEFNEHLQSNAAMTNIIYGMKYLRIKVSKLDFQSLLKERKVQNINFVHPITWYCYLWLSLYLVHTRE